MKLLWQLLSCPFTPALPPHPSLTSLASSCFLCPDQNPNPAPCCPRSLVPGSWVLGQGDFWGIRPLGLASSGSAFGSPLKLPGSDPQSSWAFLWYCLMGPDYCKSGDSETRDGQPCGVSGLWGSFQDAGFFVAPGIGLGLRCLFSGWQD